MKLYIAKRGFKDKDSGENREYTVLCFDNDGVTVDFTAKGYKIAEAFEEYGVTPRAIKAMKVGEMLKIGEF